MRTPCVFLFSPGQDEDQLAVHIWRCLVPTHNTSEAMEAAGAYGFALRAAFLGESFEEIIDAAMRGGERLLEFVEERFWAMVYPRLMSAEPCSEHSQWQAVMSLRLFVWGLPWAETRILLRLWLVL